MPKPVCDMIGVVFGTWRVVARAENRKKAVRWRLQCRCGASKIMTASDIRRAERSIRPFYCRHCSPPPPADQPLSYGYNAPEGRLAQDFFQALYCARLTLTDG